MNSINKALSYIPFSKSVFQDNKTQSINDRFEIFGSPSISKDKKIDRLSVKSKYDNYSDGGKFSNMYYHQLMTNLYNDDKTKRLKLYRTMASYHGVEQALKEIANEFFVKDDRGEIVKGKLHNDYNEEIRNIIEKEFQKFIKIYKLKEKGPQLVIDYVVEGELFWENIVSGKNPEKGIIGAIRIMPERIDPLYYDTESELIDSFVLKKKTLDEYPLQTAKFTTHSNPTEGVNQMLFLNDKQVTYVCNDKWEPNGKKYRVPPISAAHGPYTQLTLVEDATVIYMITRAPEKLFFQISTGNMPPTKADSFVNRLMGQFSSKKTVNDGKIQNTYDPISMTDNLWMAKSKDMDPSTVTTIGGGSQTMGNMEVLNYFVQKLYKALSVPLSRLNSDSAFSDGEAITREELKFAQEIMRMQTRWAESLKDAFITHLKLKGRKLFDVAEKLRIKDIELSRKSNQQSQRVTIESLKKDKFSYLTWDSVDCILEQVDSRLNDYKNSMFKHIEVLIEKRNDFTEKLAKIKTELIIENNDSNYELLVDKKKMLEDDITDIDLVIEDYQNEYQNLVDDNLSWWDQYKLQDEDLEVRFNEPSNFFALREQQKFNMKVENYNQLAADDAWSKLYLQKWLMGLTDQEILQNYAMSKISAAQKWEIDQISQNGPDWRSQLSQEKAADAIGEMGMGGNMDMGGGGETLPDFGGQLENDAGSETDLPEAGGETGEESLTMKSPLDSEIGNDEDTK